MPPIPGIPWDPLMADDVLEAADTILEGLWEVYASDHAPWDYVPPVSCRRVLLLFWFVYFPFLLYVNI
jgi:hypothetical protein